MSRFAKNMLFAGLLFLPMTGIAAAQNADPTSDCKYFQTLMTERKGLIDQLNAAAGKGKKKQLDARTACTLFTKMSSHDVKVLKWLDANKSWCQIPDDFVDSLKKDEGQISNTRGQACKVAAQMDAARKNAEQGGGAPPGWGGGVHGQYQIPKGAL